MSAAGEKWRRPIVAHAEETIAPYSGEPKRVIKWYITGPNQLEDADRLAKGMACTECLSVFPAAPTLANISIWRNYAHEWAPLRTPDEVLAMVARQQCPTCASEVSPEAFAVSFQGMDPHAPTPLEQLMDAE